MTKNIEDNNSILSILIYLCKDNHKLTAMNTMTLTFDTPDPTLFDVKAFKETMYEMAKQFFAKFSDTSAKEEVKENKSDMSFFDEFDKNGGWGDDPRDPHEIADELHDSRYNRDRTIEPW